MLDIKPSYRIITSLIRHHTRYASCRSEYETIIRSRYIIHYGFYTSINLNFKTITFYSLLLRFDYE